jgi:hypothetical protein
MFYTNDANIFDVLVLFVSVFVSFVFKNSIYYTIERNYLKFS